MTAHRVAVLGTSFGARVHAVGFQRHPAFELVAIAGHQPEKTLEIGAELGVQAFTDWRALLDRTAPDVVAIATPADLHHPMMLEALARGCHVLCEKPTALHRFQAAEMRDRAIAARRVAGINHEFRYLPARRQALALASSGAIGPLVRGEIVGHYPMWARPASRAMNWLSERSRGGGILGALGSHHTDCLRTFFGEPRAVRASVRVDQPRRGPSPAHPQGGTASADDACTVLYEFDGGATGLIDLDARAPYRAERFEIHGRDGTLRWDESEERLWRIDPGSDPVEVEISDTFRLAFAEDEPRLLAPFGIVVENVHRAIVGERAMEPSFDDAVAVQSALDAARLSSDAGCRITIEIPRALEVRD